MKNLESVEAHYHEGVFEVAAARQPGGDGVLQLQARQAGHVHLAQHREVDVAVNIHKVASLGVAHHVERGHELLVRLRTRHDDAQVVVGSYTGLETVFELYLAAVGHVLQVVYASGGDARRQRQQRHP